MLLIKARPWINLIRKQNIKRQRYLFPNRLGIHCMISIILELAFFIVPYNFMSEKVQIHYGEVIFIFVNAFSNFFFSNSISFSFIATFSSVLAKAFLFSFITFSFSFIVS